MIQSMRKSTLETMGLGSVLEIFKNGRLPVNPGEMVEKIFGPAENRGSLVISGAGGIVGAGKSMQLGSRLLPYDVPMVALDMAGAPDGLAQKYSGLVRAFGREQAAKIMQNIVKISYDGMSLPQKLKEMNPRFLLEAIPEVLELKKAHYQLFRENFPEIAIRSVTSGFPGSQLGVGIAHPAFPHEINKVWEIVEAETSDITRLLWSLGMVPIPVSDDWSFVLDVLFCGITLNGIRYHRATNMPYWKIDKYIRKFVGPNPFRAHDAIGAAGANFLTWSCLHHLGKQYGALFEPTPELIEAKDCGTNWYPHNHFRPLVNWDLDDKEQFEAWISGALFQMTALMLKEQRSHFSHLNIIGELCAQFRSGPLATIRQCGTEKAIALVEKYRTLHPEAGKSPWYPEQFDKINSPEWQQLYVNAEHDGEIGVISIGRESYNSDVDAEFNRAIDWLKQEKIDNVIVSGDFHLTTQLVGADTNDFFPALEDVQKGIAISAGWSKTARRLHDEFKISVGFIGGKRCLGGMLELMVHCHYLVCLENTGLGMPEVTLPVIPGMEGCHWTFRKTDEDGRQKLLYLILEGKQVKGKDSIGWLTDYAGPIEQSLATAWQMAQGKSDLPLRQVKIEAMQNVTNNIPELTKADSSTMQARQAIVDCIKDSCGVSLSEAIEVQAKHSGNFMTDKLCHEGIIGSEFKKKMAI